MEGLVRHQKESRRVQARSGNEAYLPIPVYRLRGKLPERYRGTVEWCCDGRTRSPTGSNGLLHQNGSRPLRPEDQGNNPIVVLRCQAQGSHPHGHHSFHQPLRASTVNNFWGWFDAPLSRTSVQFPLYWTI